MHDLTLTQQAAIEHWKKTADNRIFTGMTAKTLAADFRRTNALKQSDPAKAAANEQALFAICGVATPPP